jgi:hypothetical protein
MNGKQVLSSDVLGTLEKQLRKHKQKRLSDAKLLRMESPCLEGVPAQAVTRFLELVACHDVPPGETRNIGILCNPHRSTLFNMDAICSNAVPSPPVVFLLLSLHVYRRRKIDN